MLTTLTLMALSSVTLICLTEINNWFVYTATPEEDEYGFLNDQLH